MENETEIILTLPEVTDFDISDRGEMILDGHVVPQKDLQRIIEQSEKHGAAIVAVQRKTKFGIEKMAEIDKHGVVTYVSNVAGIIQARDQTQGKELRNIARQFANRVIDESGNSTLQAQRFGKTWILRLIHKSPIPPEPSKEERLNRLQRWWYGE